MALAPVNIGTTSNDGTGETLRSAFEKLNKPVAGYNSSTHVWADSDWQAAMADFVATQIPNAAWASSIIAHQVFS